MTTPVYPINIQQILHWFYTVLLSQPTDPIYTTPPGGFINNDETEYDAIVFDPSVFPVLVWTDILNEADGSYAYYVQQDTLPNWYNVKSEATTAVQPAALATGLAGKFNTPTGTTSQVVLGNGTIGSLPSSAKAYEGTNLRSGAFSVIKSATVSSGSAVFNLTVDGLSTGAALFPNGIITDSVNVTVSDATASYQMAWAFSNSNKTLTVTANKLTTSNILTGILGQAAANSAVVKLQVWGY